MVDENSPNTLWNIDGAQFYSIFQIKTRFVEYMLGWDLENAYWAVRTLRMEIDAKLKRGETSSLLKEIEENKKKRGKKNEKEEMDDMMKVVDESRKEYIGKKIDETQFFLILESFYMQICYIMKKNGMYYREGEDSRLAVLRR